MEELTYRQATPNDLNRLLELEQYVIESERPYDSSIKNHGASYYDINAFITDPETCLIVVDTGTEIIGSGYAQLRASKSAYTHESHCYLGFICVDPHYRGRGIAKQIIEELKEWGAAQNTRHFYLDVYSNNESAIHAYKKSGFSTLTVKMELKL